MGYGKVIEFIDQGKIHCTLCIQDKGNKYHLLTPLNQEVNIAPKRALLISNAIIDPQGNREEALIRLKQIDQLRDVLKKEICVKDLWELIKDESERYDYKYLAQLCFGDDVTDDHVAALVRALFDDKLYFRMKDGQFVPCDEEKIEQTARQIEEEARKEEELNSGSRWLKDVLLHGIPDPGKEDKTVIAMLIELALHGKEAPDFKHGMELLSRAGISNFEEARGILVKLCVWKEDEPLDLYKFNIRTAFSEDLMSEACKICRVDSTHREDLRDLPTFTVDGATTRDFDDALSVEVSGDSINIGIHIADVAGLIANGSPLDMEATLRGSSLYLPDRQIPMLPETLSEDALSLLAGKDRPAVSLLARFDMAGNLQDYRFTPSIINVKRHWTYDAVNEIYDRDKTFLTLFRLCETIQKKRVEQGALILSLPEPYFEMDDNSAISIKLVSQETPSRMMIAEMAILYNWLAARFCRDNSIPMLFRGQKPPTEKLGLEGKDYVYYVFMQRKKLFPLMIDVESCPHSGLGLDAYTNLTSPIRRYFDLACQRQMMHFLVHGSAAYNKEELEKIRLSVNPVLKDLNLIKRNRINYWMLKYFKAHVGKDFRAIVLDMMKNKARIIISDFLYVTEIKREPGQDLQTGKNIMIKVRKSDPWAEELKVEVIGQR